MKEAIDEWEWQSEFITPLPPRIGSSSNLQIYFLTSFSSTALQRAIGTLSEPVHDADSSPAGLGLRRSRSRFLSLLPRRLCDSEPGPGSFQIQTSPPQTCCATEESRSVSHAAIASMTLSFACFALISQSCVEQKLRPRTPRALLLYNCVCY